MRKIIDGNSYNTDTATKVCKMTCTAHHSDFDWHDTWLYRTSKGNWFLAGEGNGSSMWKRPAVGGDSVPGEGVRPLTEDEAREVLEQEDDVIAIDEYFTVEEA
ncbi:hypothetical protein [uncultured Devosia sp.]|uniref:hypothetical protein n=1 Tax=uncultured Devosia sp. TaxID=211434 RepID=UPI002638437C|nr:hypothetical protein [uncultured Devosia sp.]